MIFGFLQNLGFTEILLILLVCLLVFGPSKLPEVGKSLGKTVQEFKNSMNEASKPEQRETETKESTTTVKAESVEKSDEI